MLFEKTIRRKKVSPFFLEIVGGINFCELISLVGFLIFGIVDGFDLVWVVFFIIVVIVAAISACFNMANVILIWLHMQTDKKGEQIITEDVVFLNYDFSFAAYQFGAGYFYTFTHLFYLEPYIRIVIFNYLPLRERDILTVFPKFYMEEAHFTCWRQKDYKKLRAEFKKYEDDTENDRIRYDIPKKTRRDYEDANHTILYMTYDKMQAFKKLFDLVNPHEFRITKYEKSWVFISIDPIPCKEYPPEALDCMEKINTMYP